MIENVTTQEIKIACMVCCPMCDEKKCIGRFECKEIERCIEDMRKKVSE